MAYTSRNRLLYIRNVQQLARQHYEPGRQDRSWYWVWQYRVYPVYPMHYDTFLEYLKVNVDAELGKFGLVSDK